MVPLKISLPDHFLDEEERCGYIVSHEMKKVWAVMLDLLAEFDRVCKKYGIRYFACGGTALGAVRHKGFIPWDDDVDLLMFREDYNKLKEVASIEFTYPYFFQNKYTDPTANDFLAKLRNSDTTAFLSAEKDSVFPYNKGIFIDIFCVDNVPDDKAIREKFFNVLEEKRQDVIKYGQKLGIYSAVTNPMERAIKHVLYYLLKYNRKLYLSKYKEMFSEFESLCSSYANYNTKYVSSYVFGPKEELFKEKNDFKAVIECDFEFMKVPICSGYHHYLTDTFGDYMQFVKGTSWHSAIFFDTDKSYTEYTGALI